MRKILGLIVSLSLSVLFTTSHCYAKNSSDFRDSAYIKCIDTSQLWNGLPVVQLYVIKGHEYIVVRAGTPNGGVHIIHTESCSCKQK